MELLIKFSRLPREICKEIGSEFFCSSVNRFLALFTYIFFLELGFFWIYFRLTPAIIFLLLFILRLSKFACSGPFQPETIELERKGCEKSWWAMLLYIQNYRSPTNIVSIPSSFIVHIPIAFIQVYYMCKQDANRYSYTSVSTYRYANRYSYRSVCRYRCMQTGNHTSL